MEIIGKKLSLKEFNEYVEKKDFGSIPPDRLVIHHTWKPTVNSWNGIKTIYALKRFFERKGWNAGPHLFIAPDGIWLFTDMYSVGIHAGSGNAGYTKEGTLDWYSIGIEVVGNYDKKKWSGIIKKQTLGVIDSLQKNLDIANNKILFHREFSSKSCPGKAITKSWLFSELNRYKENKNNYVKPNEEIRRGIRKIKRELSIIESLL